MSTQKKAQRPRGAAHVVERQSRVSGAAQKYETQAGAPNRSGASRAAPRASARGRERGRAPRIGRADLAKSDFGRGRDSPHPFRARTYLKHCSSSSRPVGDARRRGPCGRDRHELARTPTHALTAASQARGMSEEDRMERGALDGDARRHAAMLKAGPTAKSPRLDRRREVQDGLIGSRSRRSSVSSRSPCPAPVHKPGRGCGDATRRNHGVLADCRAPGRRRAASGR